MSDPNRILIVNVIGPYFSDKYCVIEQNIILARQLSRMVFSAPGGGFGVFTPHLNTAHFETLTFVDEPTYQAFDREMIARAMDCAILVPGWEKSSGTKAEIQLFNALDRPVFEEMESLIVWRDNGGKLDNRFLRYGQTIGDQQYWITMFMSRRSWPLTASELTLFDHRRK